MCELVSETQLILKRFTEPFESAHARRCHVHWKVFFAQNT
nr:MAG TPA: hypothetical protein [Caudoviricetes sp.]